MKPVLVKGQVDLFKKNEHQISWPALRTTLHIATVIAYALETVQELYFVVATANYRLYPSEKTQVP